ncbi:MAG: hypothetical protein ACE5G5_00425 [Candidatus Methylomirabilales bacterium]
MRKHVEKRLVILPWVIVVALASGCSHFESTAPGPGVPRVSNFRIEPRVVDRGEQATLVFDFRDTDGDIMDVYIELKREVAEFTLATSLEPTLISQGRYLGKIEGTARETISVIIEERPPQLVSETRGYQGAVVEPEAPPQEIGGSRLYVVFVVDRKGNVSNRLRARVTVR